MYFFNLIIKKQICRFNRTKWSHQNIIGVGWNESEQLIIVHQDGSVLCYSLLNNEPKTADLFGFSDESVILACVGKTGAACISSNRRVYIIIFSDFMLIHNKMKQM